MAVDYAIIACLVFLESLSHLSRIPPYGSLLGGGRGGGLHVPHLISEAVLKKRPYACGCRYFTILYCNFSCPCHSFNLFSRHLSTTSSVLCCRFKATLLVAILPYMTGAWLWVWHLVRLWAHTTLQHFKILWKARTSILISVEQCDICPLLVNF